MVFGDVSLAVGDDRGDLTVWFPVRHDGKALLTRIHTLAPHGSAVQQILPSLRTKSLLSTGEDGAIHRILFLCAVLLFLLTFALNTAAELVRQRLRKRFGRF